MSVHIQPIVFTVRGYHDDVNTNVPLYQLRNEPHRFMCTIQVIDKMAHITGLIGPITLRDKRDIAKTLKEQYNITEVSWRRGDKVTTVRI